MELPTIRRLVGDAQDVCGTLLGARGRAASWSRGRELDYAVTLSATQTREQRGPGVTNSLCLSFP